MLLAGINDLVDRCADRAELDLVLNFDAFREALARVLKIRQNRGLDQRLLLLQRLLVESGGIDAAVADSERGGSER